MNEATFFYIAFLLSETLLFLSLVRSDISSMQFLIVLPSFTHVQQGDPSNFFSHSSEYSENSKELFDKYK